ncbi:hypothetical protein Pmani_005555 [Petrolisthes manimaculis]|uniref:Nucleoporin NDC1 n=1 Tax=Petrolisthes manimaculis TaxID=1843537 RepID=A0AAE1QBH4_9EUCA|nr:hypothetical protein Pmani_005555 [Petrolisthes manimaculis]
MKLEEIFLREIILWRCMRALGCVLLFQHFVSMGVCTIYRTVVAEGVINPLTILANLSTSWVMPSKLLSLTIPAICLILLARVHINNYAVSAWIPMYQWQSWRRFFTFKVQLGFSMIIGACVLLASFYTSLALPTFPQVFVRCSAEDVLCGPRKMSVICVGMFTGISYSMKYFLNNGNIITPAPAHPRKLQLIKSSLSMQKVKEACNTYGVSSFSLTCTVFLCIFASVVMCLSGGGSFPDVMHILELQLVMVVILSTLLLVTTLSVFSNILNIFLSEPIEIPLTVDEDSTSGTEEDSWRLCHTLSSSGLLQLLAFWDLKTLASADPRSLHRHTQIFTISQPGGHPRNWLGIMNPSLNLVRKFTDRLRRHNCPEELPQEPPKLVEATDVNKNEVTKPPPVPLKERLTKIVMSLKRYPIFSYFLSELPDATNRSIFAEALPVIWAVEALGDLVAASFTEDKFGIVQRNIPDILMAFVHLQKMVDSVGRVSVTRRASTSDNCQSDQQLRKALKLSLRTSIYIVTTTFGPTVLEMPVSGECRSKLQSYLEFKEA